MFAKFAIPFIAISALAVNASPVKRDSGLSRRYDWPSFNNYDGVSSLSGFDNFYGCEDFSGSHFTQTVVKENEVVCHSETVVIIQQRLAVLREMAKRIISEQICEVETQTVVFEQFHASLGSFSRDLRRYSGYQVGYDSNIAGYYGDIVGSDGSLSTNDLGFSGYDIGNNTVVPSGNNWNPSTSPASVGSAYDQAQGAYVSQN